MRVEARGLRRRFGEILALDGVSFALPAGARTALVGPNASGKSTLMRALVGLVAVEGEIAFDGHARSGRGAQGLGVARQLAYAPQHAPPLAAPVREVVAAVARLRGTAPRAIERVAARLALDLRELGAHPLRALSGGTRQKLLLALALAPRARLLILDEPTASLDARAREQFAELLGEQDAACSVILCSHRLEEIRGFANHVLRLEAGQFIHNGPPEESSP